MQQLQQLHNTVKSNTTDLSGIKPHAGLLFWVASYCTGVAVILFILYILNFASGIKVVHITSACHRQMVSSLELGPSIIINGTLNGHRHTQAFRIVQPVWCISYYAFRYELVWRDCRHQKNYYNLFYLPKSRPLHTMVGQVCEAVKVRQVMNFSLKLSFSFSKQLLPSLFIWTTECNTFKASEARLSENGKRWGWQWVTGQEEAMMLSLSSPLQVWPSRAGINTHTMPFDMVRWHAMQTNYKHIEAFRKEVRVDG